MQCRKKQALYQPVAIGINQFLLKFIVHLFKLHSETLLLPNIIRQTLQNVCPF